MLKNSNFFWYCVRPHSPAFDKDGDGVPDDDDAFPEDPDESVDTDGDGVGDNADLAPSVANDLIYSSAALVFIILAGLLFAFMRTKPRSARSQGLGR